MPRADVWAAAAVRNLGPAKAAEVARREAREWHGEKNAAPNPYRPWYLEALNWIMKRFKQQIEAAEASERKLAGE
jgi:hypothetical protein